MSESMIERVARALARHDDPKHENWWPSYETRARAAIEAMRKPDELMLAAVKPEPVHLYHGRDEEYRRRMQMATSADRLAFLTDWQRAIDAALADSESKP